MAEKKRNYGVNHYRLAMLASVKLVADPGIGLAECVVETPKGKVESLIDGHLEQVARALSKAM